MQHDNTSISQIYDHVTYVVIFVSICFKVELLVSLTTYGMTKNYHVIILHTQYVADGEKKGH